MESKGKWLVFGGAVCWSLNAPLVKYVTLDPFMLCGTRALIAGIILCPFLFRAKLNISKWLGIYLVSFVGLSVCVVVALRNAPSAVAVGMQYSSIIWIYIISLLAGKTTATLKNTLPVIIVISGVTVFMLSGSSGADITTLGLIISVIEGIFFAGITISAKKAAGDNPLGLTALGNIATAAFVFAVLPPELADIPHMGATNTIVVIILGTVQIGLGYAIYNIGMKYVPPQKAAMLSLWEMILGPLWTAVFLNEYPSFAVLTGFVLILTGMMTDAAFASGIRAGNPARAILSARWQIQKIMPTAKRIR
ncbi:MAG: DMT family transporter [Anaerovoracaceae bacterium]